MTGRMVDPDLATLFPTIIRRSAGVGAGESFLAYALDQHALVSVADADEKIIYVNDLFAEISGYAKDELIGQTHRILRSEEHPQAFYDALWATISSGKTWSGEIKHIRKNGEPYWVKATVVPFFSPSGRPEKFLSIHTDITDVKQAEAQLQRQMSFDLIKDEIYLFWPDTLKVFYVNRSGRIRLRSLGSTMTNLTSFKMLHGVSEQALCDRLAPLISGGRKWTTFEAEQMRRDGRTTPVEVTIQLIRPADENPRFLAHVRNISQRKQAEVAKQQFVANVSHELRTPLTAIKGAFGLIKTGVQRKTPEQAGQLAEMGLKNTARLEGLIENLLDMERIATGRMTSNLATVDLCRVIEAAVSDIASYKPAKGVQVRVQVADDLLHVKADVVGLSKVFGILLSNAVKFSHDGGEVTVHAHRDGARVSVRVIDTGVGIPKHFLPQMFTPFTQADSSDTRRSDGAGVGLAIARSIVEEHGGSIELRSVEGEGTEVSFYLIAHIGTVSEHPGDS
ncbi:PAS domain-containing sensor histidine kinase [Antarcticimicrobium luteum]|uniref:histidine kinase n=1 Tax=Antarcticimicrobium luteum TaxID=2547397 RepID=A0A4R5UV02_9RHOB|nr:PAS domain-containing sensor histidine kinase [Antarcticimicrobium luteum]TDK43060.1 PAS domain S-box protein [Antarcticimicrobium luteum]